MSVVQPAQSRETKYCNAVGAALQKSGHATNLELLTALRKKYPDLSATTVHRVTTRLAARGQIGIAPSDVKGTMRYDANTDAHDHFMCHSCGILRDTDVVKDVKKLVESSLDGCKISGRITISGTCAKCSIEK